MRYMALRTIYGDYGSKAPGELFDVPDDQTTLRRMKQLEIKGMVTRYRPMAARPAYKVYANKAIMPEENK